MSGQKKHNQWERCNYAHPKVCNKLLQHGTRGSQGCSGRECEKYHPRMCYSSMSDKVCTKERCTYWHCKGTIFAPDSTSSYFPPSSSSLGQYPASQARRRGRSPARGRMEERPHREMPNRQRREVRGEEEREWPEIERRRGEDRKEESNREERRGGPQAFLDLSIVTNLIREEIQRALQTLLPAVVSGSGASLPSKPVVTPGHSSWVELLTRNSTN